MRRAPPVPNGRQSGRFLAAVRAHSCGAAPRRRRNRLAAPEIFHRGSPNIDVPKWGLSSARRSWPEANRQPHSAPRGRARAQAAPAPAGLRGAARARPGEFRRCDGARRATSRLSLRNPILAACAVGGPIGCAAELSNSVFGILWLVSFRITQWPFNFGWAQHSVPSPLNPSGLHVFALHQRVSDWQGLIVI